MANVFEVYVNQDILIQLAESLDGVLSQIAYDGKSENPKWIKKEQKRLRKEYWNKIKKIKGDLQTPFGTAIDHVLTAYHHLQELNPTYKNAEDMEEEAADILQSNLIFPPEAEVVYDAFGFSLGRVPQEPLALQRMDELPQVQ